jgi:hypothetical protein
MYRMSNCLMRCLSVCHRQRNLTLVSTMQQGQQLDNSMLYGQCQLELHAYLDDRCAQKQVVWHACPTENTPCHGFLQALYGIKYPVLAMM